MFPQPGGEVALIDLGDPGDPVVEPHSGVRRQFIEPGDVLADGGQLSRQLVGDRCICRAASR